MQLAEKQCIALRKGAKSLDTETIEQLMDMIDSQWVLLASNTLISRHFKFLDFHQTMDFINAVAQIAHHQDHHPEMQIGYNYCNVSFTTHIADGLTENDFICAAKIDLLSIS